MTDPEALLAEMGETLREPKMSDAEIMAQMAEALREARKQLYLKRSDPVFNAELAGRITLLLAAYDRHKEQSDDKG